MKNPSIDSEQLQLISEMSINCALIYLKWVAENQNVKFSIGKIQKNFSCCDEVIRALNRFGDKKDKIDHDRFTVIMHGYLNNVYSPDHAKLFMLGFYIVKYITALQFSPEVGDRHFKKELGDIVSADVTNQIQKLIDGEWKKYRDEMDVNNLLIQTLSLVL